jgi:hypothetical protein
MKKSILAAIVGAAFLLPLHTSAQAAATALEICECARDIAALERSSARQTKGQERRQIIVAPGKIKTACYNGRIKQAYSAAEKLRKSPQQASAGN